jgi:hypothetical protein
MWSRAAALAGLLLAGGCSGIRAKREAFPIGLFNVEDPSLLKRIHEAGFDHVFPVGTPAQQDAVAHEARRLGMKVVASPNTALDASRVKPWPMAAWYLSDEPDVNKITPEKLRETVARVRTWDGRPQTFTVGQGSEAQRYGEIADIFMLDWYPVPHLALDSVANQIDIAMRSLPKGKPLWFVVQAFDWRDDHHRIGRFPEHHEIRFMSWLAIMHGAKGLFFFRFPRPGGKTLLDFPEFWRSVELVARELKSFQPILEKGSPAPLPFTSDPDGVEARSWSFQGRRYVLVLNRREAVQLKLPDGLLKTEWKLHSAPGSDVKALLTAAHGAWYVKPYQVLVFEGPS